MLRWLFIYLGALPKWSQCVSNTAKIRSYGTVYLSQCSVRSCEYPPPRYFSHILPLEAILATTILFSALHVDVRDTYPHIKFLSLITFCISPHWLLQAVWIVRAVSMWAQIKIKQNLAVSLARRSSSITTRLPKTHCCLWFLNTKLCWFEQQ